MKDTESQPNGEFDRREFERISIGFVLEVLAEDFEGNSYTDRAVLQDVSGGGAKFVTKQREKYFPGQILEISIHLPGTDEVKAYMKGKATVVRINSTDDPRKRETGRRTRIAVKFENPLHLERLI